MTDEEIDAVLAGLAAEAAEMIADTAVAERDMEVWCDESERYLESSVQVEWRRPDPRRAVASLRSTAAIDAARNLRQATRELVAWWVDLAIYTVLATASGRPIDPVRAAGLDPSSHLTAEDLSCLPMPSENDRMLAGLAARMADTPVGPQEQRDDLSALTRDLTARTGLALGRSADGELTAIDDLFVEARRRRLWGDIWVDHRLPELLDAGRLADALTACGVSPEVTADIRDAAAAVDDVVAAARHFSELEDLHEEKGPDPAVMQQIDDLWEHIKYGTDILARYARTLVRHLPAIRATARAQPHS